MNIVGFTGLKGSGKDTAADVLVEAGYKKLSFALPLKAMLHTLFTIQGGSFVHAERAVHGSVAEKETPSDFLAGRTPRHAMQTLGTEWGRNLISEDIWVNAVQRYITSQPFPRNYVISDVRFQNEVDMINSFPGGRVYKIIRAGQTVSEDAHISEKGIENLSGTIRLLNNFPLDMFREDVRNFCVQS